MILESTHKIEIEIGLIRAIFKQSGKVEVKMARLVRLLG